MLAAVIAHECACILPLFSVPSPSPVLREMVLHGEEEGMFVMAVCSTCLLEVAVILLEVSLSEWGSVLLTALLSLRALLLAPSLLNILKVWSKTIKLGMLWTWTCTSWFPALQTLIVLRLDLMLIILLAVIIQLKSWRKTRAYFSLYICNCPQTRHTELLTTVVQHFAFIWNLCLTSKERVWSVALWLPSPMDSLFCHLTPDRN